MVASRQAPIEVFYSYSHKDEELRDELEKHLKLLQRQNLISVWHDRKITAGNDWEGQIDDNLKRADIILLLISADFLASDYCYDIELKGALQRHDRGDAQVIPILLRPVNWDSAPFRRLLALPTDAKPVTKWRSRDEAFVDIVEGIKRTISELQETRNARNEEAAMPNSPPQSSNDAQSSTLTATGATHLEITIEGDYDSFSDVKKGKVLEAIRALLDTDEDVKIGRIRRGSIKMQLEVASNLAERLLYAVNAGELHHLGITHAKMIDIEDFASSIDIESDPRATEAPRETPAAPCRDATTQESITPAPYFRWRGVLDRAMAALLLIPGLPLIGLSILFVRITSRGPGIYRQARVGRNRRPFTMYKIRTTYQDAKDQTGAAWTLEDDSRITRVGRYLRWSHMDEMPQLFNVLRGEMSLVGPRPERPMFVKVLATEIPNYLDRFAVPPGITGLAQINLLPDTDIESVHRKTVLDSEYIRHASLGLDFRILLCTLLRLAGRSGEFAARITGVRRKVPRLSDSARLSVSVEPVSPPEHSETVRRKIR